MDAISQMTFSIFQHEIAVFWFKFHWKFRGFWFKICQHWFIWCLDAEQVQVTSHCLKQRWPSLVTHICDIQPQCVDEAYCEQYDGTASGRFSGSQSWLIDITSNSTHTMMSFKYFCKIAIRRMPQHLTDHLSTLVQVMAWCHQATSHYLSQCWPRSMLPFDVTRPQWVNIHLNGVFTLKAIQIKVICSTCAHYKSYTYKYMQWLALMMVLP